jgi:phospholipid/cholesterol/gamma-HCH transport system ATP-binding protein
VEGTLEDMFAFDDPWVQSYFRGKRARSVVTHEKTAQPQVEK